MDDLELMDEIQDAAYQVRRALQPGYLESVYQNALIYELRMRGFVAEKEVPVYVEYKGYPVGEFRADILVNKRIILELKAVKELLPIHEAQLVNYLVATGLDHGALINYGGEKFSFHRKTREYRPKKP